MHLQARLFPRGAASRRLIDAALPSERRQVTSSRVAVPVQEVGALRHAGAAAAGFGATGWHGWPARVVSRRVVEVLRRSRVRGWHYRPVLIRDRPPYSQYLADWQALAAAVAVTTRIRFEGGRW